MNVTYESLLALPNNILFCEYTEVGAALYKKTDTIFDDAGAAIDIKVKPLFRIDGDAEAAMGFNKMRVAVRATKVYHVLTREELNNVVLLIAGVISSEKAAALSVDAGLDITQPAVPKAADQNLHEVLQENYGDHETKLIPSERVSYPSEVPAAQESTQLPVNLESLDADSAE